MKNKLDEHLIQKLQNSKYPTKYKIFFQNISDKETPGKIFKKKRQESIANKVSKKWVVFWDVVEDDDAKCCFICGYYIRPSHREEPGVRKPFKKGDICHVECYSKNIGMDDITQKLNPESKLICHIDQPDKPNQIVCRKRVYNNPYSILEHALDHMNQEIPKLEKIENLDHYWVDNFNIDWKTFRNRHFLRPTGEPFRH